MIVLDTNVLSELMRVNPSTAVEARIKSNRRNTLFITAITQAEILYGISILPQGTRKQQLYRAAEDIFSREFKNRILPFNHESANQFAVISSHRRSLGSPISQFDAQIAAICSVNKASIATRNTKDFANCRIDIINPWDTTYRRTV